ncbi:uncharacterized protein [Watersipora subatra]|uniref:uncharacterized protein n=1 Tax=Watersipora subatra TaxID=2589382 RepID=UPI00355C8952
MNCKDTSISSLEHVMVSERGNYQYIRASLDEGSSLSRFICSLKMYPNSEQTLTDIRYIYPKLMKKVESKQGLTTLDYVFTEPLNCYSLTDSQQRDRQSPLYHFSFQQMVPSISVPDHGRGLLLLNNILFEEGGTDWQPLTLKDLLPYKKSLSKPLLATISVAAPARAVTISQPSDLIIALDHPDCKNSAQVGGKGSQLAVLYQAGLQCCIPMAACLTVEAFNLQLETCPHLSVLFSQLNSSVDASIESVKDCA